MNSKSKSTTFLLCYFLGYLGVHRFYLNKVLSGILMLITGGGLGLWWLLDVYWITRGRMQDKEGQDLYVGPPDPDNPKAGFWVRVAAMSVDGILLQLLLLITIAVPTFAAMFLLLGITDPGELANMSQADMGEANQQMQLLSTVMSILMNLIILLYFALPLTRQHQATLGKRCFGLHVLTKSGESLGLLRALWRTLCYFISAIPLFIGYILAGFKNKRALHDLLAGTQVLYVAESGSEQLSVAESEAITEVGAGSETDAGVDRNSTSTRGPVLVMMLGIVLLIVAGALALL